jgi:hypothetical protein
MLPKAVFYYLFVSYLLTPFTLHYAKDRNRGGKLVDFLCFFMPVAALVYLQLASENNYKSNNVFLVLWIIFGVYFFIVRRMCGLAG